MCRVVLYCFVLHCVVGYRGMNCEIDIDDCLEQPCRHGVCEDLLNQYYCNCTDTGWYRSD